MTTAVNKSNSCCDFRMLFQPGDTNIRVFVGLFRDYTTNEQNSNDNSVRNRENPKTTQYISTDSHDS
jgi:hypothetical protein